ncbi:pentatricopeptide repeat-containing protein [Pyrus ussuriensis x Pyrus communis]|uniref:Pentatricopeptide repeat-containing protein n=1 Tax=Pyrus ussuriensis x Pyrus communis TaxID=2448454 RepID=A0A5N5GIU3_9ROSA|nr:pentatricopeptide repeat-containing protein [Pyrus ussuriensis x Pyrus communis]
MTGKTKNFAKQHAWFWYILADRRAAMRPYLHRQLLLHYHMREIKDKPSFNLRMMGFISKDVQPTRNPSAKI